MILWIADDRDPAAIRLHGLAFRYGVDGVVGALAVHVRPKRHEQWTDGGFGKNDDVVDASESDDELRKWVERGVGYARSLPPK